MFKPFIWLCVIISITADRLPTQQYNQYNQQNQQHQQQYNNYQQPRPATSGHYRQQSQYSGQYSGYNQGGIPTPYDIRRPPLYSGRLYGPPEIHPVSDCPPSTVNQKPHTVDDTQNPKLPEPKHPECSVENGCVATSPPLTPVIPQPDFSGYQPVYSHYPGQDFGPPQVIPGLLPPVYCDHDQIPHTPQHVPEHVPQSPQSGYPQSGYPQSGYPQEHQSPPPTNHYGNGNEFVPETPEEAEVINPKEHRAPSKIQIRRPAVHKHFYDIEERVIIRPAGHALIEFNDEQSSEKPSEKPVNNPQPKYDTANSNTVPTDTSVIPLGSDKTYQDSDTPPTQSDNSNFTPEYPSSSSNGDSANYPVDNDSQGSVSSTPSSVDQTDRTSNSNYVPNLNADSPQNTDYDSSYNQDSGVQSSTANPSYSSFDGTDSSLGTHQDDSQISSVSLNSKSDVDSVAPTSFDAPPSGDYRQGGYTSNYKQPLRYNHEKFAHLRENLVHREHLLEKKEKEIRQEQAQVQAEKADLNRQEKIALNADSEQIVSTPYNIPQTDKYNNPRANYRGRYSQPVGPRFNQYRAGNLNYGQSNTGVEVQATVKPLYLQNRGQSTPNYDTANYDRLSKYTAPSSTVQSYTPTTPSYNQQGFGQSTTAQYNQQPTQSTRNHNQQVYSQYTNGVSGSSTVTPVIRPAFTANYKTSYAGKQVSAQINTADLLPSAEIQPGVRIRTNGVPVDLDGEDAVDGASTPVPLSRRPTPGEIAENEKKYITLLTGRNGVTEEGFNIGEKKFSGALISGPEGKETVISATPAPPNQPAAKEQVYTRRVVLSMPTETIQEIIVTPDETIPETPQTTNTAAAYVKPVHVGRQQQYNSYSSRVVSTTPNVLDQPVQLSNDQSYSRPVTDCDDQNSKIGNKADYTGITITNNGVASKTITSDYAPSQIRVQPAKIKFNGSPFLRFLLAFLEQELPNLVKVIKKSRTKLGPRPLI